MMDRDIVFSITEAGVKENVQCEIHGVEMETDDILLHRDGGIYAVGEGRRACTCSECLQYMTDIEDDPVRSFGVWASRIKKEFDAWDEGERSLDLFRYLCDGTKAEADTMAGDIALSMEDSDDE